MPKWYSVPLTSRMSPGEYRANITGLNVVFGAVLGFVLAGAEALSTTDFIFLLLVASASVVTILYLGSSEYKLFYGVFAIVIAVTIPWLLKQAGLPPVPKLQPTIATWIAMVIFIEILPRTKDDGDDTKPPPSS